MTNRKHVEHEIAAQACELTADELESVSGGKPASKEASGVMFLKFTFKLVAVK
jgi:bacteriocin-like protein